MPLQLPHELAENLEKGRVVLFVGSGMSQPQLPGWRGLLEQMVQQAELNGIYIDSHRKLEIGELIAKDELLVAAGKVKQALGKDFHSILKRVFTSANPTPTAAHKLLPRLPLKAVVTTNYDKLLEGVYPGSTHTSIHPKIPSLKEDFFLWKLHGDIDDADSIVLDETDYDALSVDSRIVTVLNGLFQHATVLFVGYGLKDPDLLLVLKELTTILQQQTGPHFALMRTNGMPVWERDRFRDYYRIRIFGDDARDGLPDIEGLLRELDQQGPMTIGYPATDTTTREPVGPMARKPPGLTTEPNPGEIDRTGDYSIRLSTRTMVRLATIVALANIIAQTLWNSIPRLLMSIPNIQPKDWLLSTIVGVSSIISSGIFGASFIVAVIIAEKLRYPEQATHRHTRPKHA